VTGSVAAIILAAGASRRLGQPKQLLMHDGEKLLERADRLAGAASAVPVIAVLGANSEIIRAEVVLANSVLSINDHWEEGIATSIHAGLKTLAAISPDAQGVLILTCDQPRLSVEHLRTLIETFIAQSRPMIVASAYAGAIGIPAVFPRQAFPHLLALRGDKGARALLLEPPCPLIEMPFPGGEIDIDRPEDLEHLE
jgi:molybdenum cofactor cytidylyltransferase